MAGQPPYKPFENDRVKWVKPSSETGKPILSARGKEDWSFRKPAVLVFLASTDGDSCCAANYERIVFRDRKVLAAAKRFVTMRLDRAALKPAVLKRFGVKKGKPAIRVTDCEGVVVGKFDLCANARDMVKAMVATLKRSKKKTKVARKMEDHFADVKKALAQPSYREAAKLLRRLKRLKGGPDAGYARTARLMSELTKEGDRQFKQALTMGTVDQFDMLLNLRHEFWNFPVEKLVRRQLVKLETDETTKDTIHAHKGNKLVAEAEALIREKKASQGRGILRKVRRDFAGTSAAKRASKLLDKN